MKPRNIIAGLAAGLLFAGVSAAHPVAVDGDPSDWTLAPPGNINTGHIGRNGALEGEFVWTDLPGDERTDFESPDPRVDITELRLTSDATRLYFLLKMTDIDLESSNGAPQVQVAIDLDCQSGSGQTWLGAFADTQVSPAAAWEYLVVTRFGSGNPALLYNTSWSDINDGSVATAISATRDAIEIALPWALVGGAPSGPLHFTVVSLRANQTDQAWDISGESNVLDAVTNYFDPGQTPNTFAEVGDSVVDYHFEVWFHLDPDLEPSPPLVVNEVKYSPTGAEPDEEWVEVLNRTGINGLSVVGFKVGDEETVDGLEDMAAFPPGSAISADDVVVVAFSASAFFNSHGFNADFEILDTFALVPELISYINWSTGTMNLDNTGDQVLLLDPYDTVLDVVTWGTGPYPGVIAAPSVSAGHSIERPQRREDSNDGSTDFVDQSVETPGSVFWLKNPGDTCTSPLECLSGFCADGFCCQTACDGVCDGSCDSTGTCQPVVCPAPSNECRLLICNSVTGCFVAAGDACTDTDASDCNQAQCDGLGNCDQAHAPEGSAYICRPATGACDLEETCPGGAGGACPGDGFLSPTERCRAAAGVCDLAEYCTGSMADCPMDTFEPFTMLCNPAAGVCDLAEYCTGTMADCPLDAFEPSTKACRAVAGVCDITESCTGSSAECPPDAFEPSTRVCQAAAGVCDIAESCTGSSAECPQDALEPSSTICRGAAGACDIPENCTGSSVGCPPDALEPSSTVCRGAAGVCDIPESCTGSSVGCPQDAFEPASIVCRDAAGICDLTEYCPGDAADCPQDGFEPASTGCRAAAGVCDLTDYCPGDAADCPQDGFEPASTECRAAVDDCDLAEHCTGSFVDCPTDQTQPDDTSCDDGDRCTENDKCQGGSCAGTAKDCSSVSQVCKTGVCNPATGQCQAQAVEDGAGCDDQDACTENETCQGGVCTGGTFTCEESGCGCGLQGEGATGPLPIALLFALALVVRKKKGSGATLIPN